MVTTSKAPTITALPGLKAKSFVVTDSPKPGVVGLCSENLAGLSVRSRLERVNGPGMHFSFRMTRAGFGPHGERVATGHCEVDDRRPISAATARSLQESIQDRRDVYAVWVTPRDADQPCWRCVGWVKVEGLAL